MKQLNIGTKIYRPQCLKKKSVCCFSREKTASNLSGLLINRITPPTVNPEKRVDFDPRNKMYFQQKQYVFGRTRDITEKTQGKNFILKKKLVNNSRAF